jgi:hypothetical protein
MWRLLIILAGAGLLSCTPRSHAPETSHTQGSELRPADTGDSSNASAPPVVELDPLAPSPRLLAMQPQYDASVVLPSAADLTGVWYEVPATAPPGPFRRPPPCYEGLGWIALEQRAEHVAMLRHFATPMQGMKPAEQIETHERAAGTRQHDAVELSAELVRETTNYRGHTRREVLARPRWSLAFDRTTGHLVGTRDEVALRLAPLVLVAPPDDTSMRERCGRPPS